MKKEPENALLPLPTSKLYRAVVKVRDNWIPQHMVQKYPDSTYVVEATFALLEVLRRHPNVLNLIYEDEITATTTRH